MNRRTVLRSAAVGVTAGLAGCVESLQSHFQGSFQGVVPMEITNEGDRPQSIQLEAYAVENDRQTYDEGYSVTPDERVFPPHLERNEQRFRVTRVEDDETGSVDTARITPDVNLVLVRIYDDDVEIELVFDEDEAENVSEADDDRDRSADGGETSDGTETSDGD